jgi:hypothetical protein
MNSRGHSASAPPRATRAKTGMLKMPMAMMALSAPGPKIAVIITADSRAGKAKTMSEARISTSSATPRFAAAQQPSGTPTAMPMPTAISATAMELRLPTMIMERMSRPK